MLPIVLFIIAVVLAAVATFIATVGPSGEPPSWKVNLGWLALAFFIAGTLAEKGVL